jgi:hypothetical protein
MVCRSGLHRGILFVVLAAALASASVILGGGESRNRASQLALLLPAQGAAHLAVSGEPLVRLGGLHFLEPLLADRRGSAWMEPLVEEVGELERRLRAQLAAWGGLALEDLAGILRCHAVLTLVGAGPGEIEHAGRRIPAPVPELILLLDYRNDLPAVRRVLEWLEDVVLLGGRTSPVLLGGMPVTRFVAIGPPYVEFYYAFQGPLLVAGTDRESFTRVLLRLKGARDGASLARNPAWREARGVIGAPREILSLHADLVRLAGMWLGLDPPRTRRLLEAAGFGGLENFAYGLALERGGFCERLQVPAPAGTGETLEVELRRNGERELRAGEGERELLRLRAPLPMIFDVLWGWRLRADPLAGLQRQWRLRSFERDSGFSLAGDLLPLLGPGVTVVDTGTDAEATTLGMRIEAREVARLAPMLRRGAAGLAWTVRETELADGRQAWVAQGEGAAIAAAWTFDADQLLVAPSPAALEPLLAAEAAWSPGPGTGEGDRSLISLEADPASLATVLRRSGSEAWAELIPPLRWRGLDLRDAPSEAVLREALGRIHVDVRWRGEGLAVDLSSATGVLIWAALGFGVERLAPLLPR